MYSIRTIFILIAMLLGSAPISPASAVDSLTPNSGPPVLLAAVTPAEPVASLAPTITVTGASPDQADRVDVALERFRTQGLMLPDMAVVFATEDPDVCRGHLGLFSHNTTPLQLTICSDLGFVVTHEFAHAWIDVHLGEEDRLDYVTARGLETWNGRDVEWKERGVEDAAFVVQQNLMLIGAGKTSNTVMERIDAYEVLTGQTSPLRP